MRAWILVPLLAACSHTLSGPCPELTEVHNLATPDAPAEVINTQSADLAVSGGGFEILPQGLKSSDVEIPRAWMELDGNEVGLDVFYIDDDDLQVHVPLTDPPIPEGLYDLVVENPSGCSDRLPEAILVRASTLDDSISIFEIIPPFGWTESATAVTIRGDGFISTPRAWLSSGSLVRDWELDQVAFVDPTSLTGIVPEGLPVGGPYDVIVENPGGGFNLLEDGFTVTEAAPPFILTVVPEAGETSDDTPVVITGEHFDPGATVVLIDVDGNVTSATVDSSSATEIQATVPSSSMAVGAWLVQVVNEDGTWDSHAAFVVRNPSAKLGTAGAFAESVPLTTPRVGLGLVSYVDQLGRGFLYAVGGSDGTGSLATVERAEADAFGTLTPWAVLPTETITPRAHGAVVQIDGWIYAIGGDDGSGPVDTVERARILVDDADVRPSITDATVTAGGGTLVAGTWYYRVSAVMDANDADNPGGETTASGSYVVRLGEDSSVTLTWTPVAGAASYRVYRTDAVDGAAGTEHRIASDLTATSYEDTGDAAGTEPFVPEGALGTWQELPTRIPTGWAHGAAVLAADPNGDRFVYLVGGTDGASSLATVHAMREDGSWFTAGSLETARVDNMATFAGYEQAQNLGVGTATFLIALEGDDGAGATNDTVYAPIQAGGTVGAWATLDALNAGGQARLDGIGLAAAGHLYILGGSGDPTGASDSGRQSEIQGPDMHMGSWSSTSATGTFAVPRADFGMVQLRAVLYAAGGRTDAVDATASVEQVVF